MTFFAYYAVGQIPLGDAIAIIFSSPVFTVFFEWLLVRKTRGLAYKFLFSIILLTGIVLVLQPPFLHFNQEEHQEYSTSEYLGIGKKCIELTNPQFSSYAHRTK